MATYDDPVHRYLAAWNAHDPPAVAACFVEGGTYTDPASGQVPATALADYVTALLEAFPDLAFDAVAVAAGPEAVTLTWTMRGTHRGAFVGLPATGRHVSLDGVDLITLDGGGIRSVQGFFDRQRLLEQLGAAVTVRPASSERLAFGVATRVRPGQPGVPGCLGLTWIDVRSDAEENLVRDTSMGIVADLAEDRGFLGWVGMSVGRRMYTITAWRDAAAAARLAANQKHRAAVGTAFSGGLGDALHTSLWQPLRHNAHWTRCPACRALVDAAGGGPCSCGARAPEVPVAL